MILKFGRQAVHVWQGGLLRTSRSATSTSSRGGGGKLPLVGIAVGTRSIFTNLSEIIKQF